MRNEDWVVLSLARIAGQARPHGLVPVVPRRASLSTEDQSFHGG